MKTKQKKFKFSKGEINPKLLERQDLPVLEASGRYMLNVISTPFGSAKTRGGTLNVDKVATNKQAFSTPTITNGLGGTDANWYNLTAMYVSGGVEGVTSWLKYDFGSSSTMFKIYGENLYFDYESAQLTPIITDGVITGVIVSNAGKGLNNATVTVTDVLGEDAEITLTVNSSGVITGTTIVDGGSGYSNKTRLTVSADEPTDTLTIQASQNDVDWDDIDTWDVTSTNTDFVKEIDASYQYIRITGGGTVKGVFNAYNVRVYSDLAEATSIKLASFVFNLDQKYVLVLKDEQIRIYQNDALIDTVTATGMLDIYFDKLKVTQAEDTMIFTHPDMRTKQLQRGYSGGVTWTWSDFPWENVPYDDFGNTSTSQPAFNITPSDTEGSVKITGTGTFTSAYVGQIIDGNGGRLRVTEYESATVVYGYTIIPFYTTATINSGNWDYISGYELVWSVTNGYPSTCQFYEQKLWFGGAKGKPNTIYASRTGQYNDFDNIANYENDGINQTIASEQIDEIVNIYPNRGIQVFTAGAEWIVPEGATTPNSFSITKNTSNGSLANVCPVDIAGTTLFVEKNGKSLLGFVYNDGQASYITSSLSLLTDLINNPVGMAVDYNSAQDVGNFLYMPMEDGTMVTWCIILDQKIQSPTRHESADGGLIKDVVNVAGDTYILVDRKDVIFLEKLNQAKVDMLTTDSSLSASISGLDDYTGSFVRVYNDADGDLGTHFVIDGEITLSSTPTASVNIGYTFPFAIWGNKVAVNAQTENIDTRIAKATVATKNTDKLTFCGQQLEQSDDVYDFYGVTSWARDTFYTITGDSYDFMEVLSIVLNINYGEK